MDFFDSLCDVVGGTVSFVGKTIGNVAEATYDGVAYVASGTVDVAGKVVTTVAEETLNVVEKAVDYAIENPGKAALMVAGTAMGAPMLARAITSGGTLSAAAKAIATAAAVETGKNAPSLVTMAMTAGATMTTSGPTVAPAIGTIVASAKIAAACKKHLGDSVHLKPGAIVHCNLFVAVEHTGIYIGNGQIVELTGEGEIRITDFYGFTEGTGAENVYAACDGDRLLYSESIKNRALSYVNSSRNYNLLVNNCHKFTAQCVTGNQCNTTTLFTFLEAEIMKHFGVFPLQWRRAVASDKSTQTTNTSNIQHQQTHHNEQTVKTEIPEQNETHEGFFNFFSFTNPMFKPAFEIQEQITYIIVINDVEIEVKNVEKTLEVLARMMHDRCLQFLEASKQGYFDKSSQCIDEYLALMKARDGLKEISGVI